LRLFYHQIHTINGFCNWVRMLCSVPHSCSHNDWKQQRGHTKLVSLTVFYSKWILKDQVPWLESQCIMISFTMSEDNKSPHRSQYSIWISLNEQQEFLELDRFKGSSMQADVSCRPCNTIHYSVLASPFAETILYSQLLLNFCSF
jgi:hypothetical protein